MEFGVSADAYRSDVTRRTSRVGAEALRLVLSALVFGLALWGFAAAFGGEGGPVVNLWVLLCALAVGVLAYASIHVVLDWERLVVLRFGKYNRISGPGLVLIIPLVEYSTMRVDLRTRITPFGAEETLTADVVPLDIDAVLTWCIWDPEKACTEVEDVCFAVTLVAQTALRNAIGRAAAADVVMRREQLDREIRDAVEARVSEWGASVVNVEIRDILIPQELQDTMSQEAHADRRKRARISLIESERDIAETLMEVAEIYGKPEVAYDLRKMHLVSEGVLSEGAAMVVPSAYTEGFAKD
ncbi:MAG: slipin family protein [Eggerthellaceae bacterium]|nr:slipin family protein [Eggerthellaceae bacterium]